MRRSQSGGDSINRKPGAAFLPSSSGGDPDFNIAVAQHTSLYGTAAAANFVFWDTPGSDCRLCSSGRLIYGRIQACPRP